MLPRARQVGVHWRLAFLDDTIIRLASGTTVTSDSPVQNDNCNMFGPCPLGSYPQ